MKAVKVLDRTLETITAVLFIALIAVICIQILSRYFPYTAVWTEELSRYLFIYAVVFAAPLGIRKGEFIKVEVLFNRLPAKRRAVYEGVIYSVITLLCGVILVQSFSFYQLGIGFSSSTLHVEMSTFYASMVILFLFLVVYGGLYVVDLLKGGGE
ncbi:TRAP transporter small permease [Desmospora activa]|uniref:TRAP-type C4-dicarboxylate transport system permease small subunit n=1 Tax=Desmospora activa DSM 45169 TaxID=1121389 RepID=A0A2T4Z3X8_9BACL|nr:TRAP transporter small permease [Desmospora activa]PTM56594.1 TRAP-type C4-dicarboxylate transport system permease small subunit [Desmospora activa DSM 45169]